MEFLIFYWYTGKSAVKGRSGSIKSPLRAIYGYAVAEANAVRLWSRRVHKAKRIPTEEIPSGREIYYFSCIFIVMSFNRSEWIMYFLLKIISEITAVTQGIANIITIIPFFAPTG